MSKYKEDTLVSHGKVKPTTVHQLFKVKQLSLLCNACITIHNHFFSKGDGTRWRLSINPENECSISCMPRNSRSTRLSRRCLHITPLASILLQIILTCCYVIKGAQYLVDKAGSADKELRTFEGYHHDLIREQGKEQVYEEIFGWLLQRTTLTNNNNIAPESLPAEPTATME